MSGDRSTRMSPGRMSARFEFSRSPAFRPLAHRSQERTGWRRSFSGSIAGRLEASRDTGRPAVAAVVVLLRGFRIAPNRSSESYSDATTPLQMSSIQARRRRLGREAFDFEALIGIWRGLVTVQRCAHWRQAQTDTRTPRSRRISSRLIQTLEAAHSGQGDFMANVGVYRYGALLRYRAICR